ncbi:MAG: PadR family transcriptional regulator [Pyrinomonadaceae bacterium]|jgi:DNA-binding PadR family transcriptional regulator|nr:PadR family transcriptional regulator [Pyrinomonadaceae bacterium]
MVNEFPKLSSKEMKALEMLIHNGEMFGLEMVEASEGELKRGTIYVTLSRMCDKGYIESREERRTAPEIGIPRRKYWATGLGERVYQANVRANEIFRELAWGGV